MTESEFPCDALLPLRLILTHVYKGQNVPARSVWMSWINDGLCGVRLPAIPHRNHYLISLAQFMFWQSEVEVEARLSAGERRIQSEQTETEADRKRRAEATLERIKRM